MNENAEIISQSDSMTIREEDLDKWHSFMLRTPPLIMNNTRILAGLATPPAMEGYFPLGTQYEKSTRANTFFYSPLTGGSVSPIDAKRLMIGITLADLTSVNYKEETESNIWVYPNPAGSELYLTFTEDPGDLVIEITDVAGKSLRVMHHRVTNNPVRISLENIDPGIYILRVNSKKRSFVTKFLKNKDL